jgi:zinc protease
MLKHSLKFTLLAVVAFSLFMISCNDATNTQKSSANTEAKLSIEFEKYQLKNGLEVVLHQDKSDPIVSLAIQYGVGSNREKTGRTGFAHLFEHMLFQESGWNFCTQCNSVFIRFFNRYLRFFLFFFTRCKCDKDYGY